MRVPILTLLIAFAASAHAQFGVGLVPSAQCPYGYAPGPGAINGRDEVSNLQGRFEQRHNELERVNEELDGLDDKFARAREDMGRVLPGNAIQSIEDHRTFKRGYYDYYDCPKNPGATASASGAGVTATLPKRGRSANPGGSANTTPIYPPDEFCYRGNGETVNTWANFVDDDGKFSDEVCDYKMPSFIGRPASADSSDCREGMRDYYKLVARREALERKRAQLDAECRSLERKLDRIEEEVAEGNYCPYCNSERRGYSTGSLTESIAPMFGVLSRAGGSMFGQQQQPQYGGAPQYLPFPGPGAYPGNAYPAVTPGYMGVYNGVYGGMPGGIGRGAFGCDGTTPMIGSPYATSAMPYMGGQASRLGNPYYTSLMNPSQQSPLFNPGFGPGFAPTLGNGVNGYNLMPPGTMMPGQQQGNPFLSLYGPGQGQGGGPNGLPYMGGGGPNYFQQPYRMGGGNPYYAGGGGGQRFGAGTPVMTPFGPGVIPGGGIVNPYGWGNAYGYGNPGSMGGPSQINNLYFQMQQMRSSLGSIYGSPYYGGYSPPQLPYPGPSLGYGGGAGPGYGYGGGAGYGYGYGYGFGYGGGFTSPIYNIPGSVINPQPAPLPTPLPPVTNPGGGTTTPGGIIRSR